MVICSLEAVSYFRTKFYFVSSRSRELMFYKMLRHCVSKRVDSYCKTDALGVIQICVDHICLEPTPNLEEEAYVAVSKMFYPKTHIGLN